MFRVMGKVEIALERKCAELGIASDEENVRSKSVKGKDLLLRYMQ